MKLKINFLLSFVLCCFVFTACKKENASNITSVIPKDAVFVSNFNLKSMKEKCNSNLFVSLMKTSSNNKLNEVLTILSEKPDEFGVNLEDAYLFVKIDGRSKLYVAGAIQLDEVSKFEKMLDKYVIKEGKDKFKIVSNDRNYRELSENSQSTSMKDVSLVWSNNSLMFYFHDDWDTDISEEIVSNFEGKSNLGENKDFLKFIAQKNDLSFWVNYGELMASVKEFDLGIAELKDAYIQTGVNFDKGAIKTVTKVEPEKAINNLMKKYPILKSELDTKMFSFFPNKTFVTAWISVNLEEVTKNLIKAIQHSEEFNKSEVDEIYNKKEIQTVLKALTGDVMLSIFDFQNGLLPTPIFSMVVGVKSEADFKKIIELLPSNELVKRDNFYSYSVYGMFEFFLVFKGKYMYITNNEASLSVFLEGGYKDNLSDVNFVKNSKNATNLIYLNLDFQNYPIAFQRMTRPYQDYLSSTQEFESLIYKINDNNEFEFEVAFKNKSVNSLQVLFEMIKNQVDNEMGISSDDDADLNNDDDED